MFHNIYIEPINQTELNVGPCCLSQHQRVPASEFRYDRNEFLASIRQDMETGNRPKACDRCWQIEDSGGRSRRHSRLDDRSFISYHPQLRSVDVNVTWACNLACVMCGPAWSSSWARELVTEHADLEHMGRHSIKKNRFLKLLDLSAVDAVHFNGGEPLLNHEHLKVLEKMATQGTLETAAISYNTNGTCYPDSETIALWNKSKSVKIYFSIDAVADAFEYIRYPASWNQVNENIMRMKKSLPGNVMFGVNATIGAYNVFEIVDVLDWFYKNLDTNREGDTSDFVWQISNGFDPGNLNDRAKAAAIIHLEPYEIFQPLLAIISAGYQKDDWISTLGKIDGRRNTNWRQVLAVATYYSHNTHA